MAVLSENKHSIVIVANILSERIGEIYNVLILYILSLKSSVETSRLQWLEKNNQEKRHSGGQTLELLCVPFSFRDSGGGGGKTLGNTTLIQKLEELQEPGGFLY